MTLRLHNLQNKPGARRRTKRYGCGESSGHGKTSGRGGKGQTARSGGGIRLGFEGGQMPLLRRIPKRGFNSAAFRKQFAVVNVGALDIFADGTVVTPELLIGAGLVRKVMSGVKILGDGQLSKKLTVRAHSFSARARASIEAAGGVCEVIPLRRAAAAAASAS